MALPDAKAAHPLEAFFRPLSIAMVGATAAPEKIAGRRWKTLVEGGFSGPLYPIHLSAKEVRGCRAYPALPDVPGPVDLAIIVLQPGQTLEVARQCAALGVGAVVVISGGFGESDREGKRLESELVDLLRAAGIRMIGPNCAGIASLPAAVNLLGWEVPPGRVGLISQSGNMALNFAHLARSTRGGFSRQVTIGNAADVGVAEVVDYLQADPETDVILIYLEGWRPGEGRELVELARRAERPKPIVVLNPGRTGSGRRAALSHTGALAAAERIASAAYRQAGIVRVDDIEEAWYVAMALVDLPILESDAICVLSDGGGHATMAADALELAGLRLPILEQATQARLAAQLPPRCNIENPVDFAGVAETEPPAIPPVLDMCLADPGVGGAVLVGHFGGYHRIGGVTLEGQEVAAAEAMVQVARRHGKPFLVHSVYGSEALPALDRLRDAGHPVSSSIPGLARLARSLRLAEERPTAAPAEMALAPPPDGAQVRALFEAAAPGPPRWLMEPEARALLECYGIAVPAHRVACSAAACAEAMAALGGPLALKLIAPDIVHKSERDGVELDVRSAAAARRAYRRLAGLTNGPARVLLTPMITDGVETVFGAFRDPHFGPVVMFGLGGVFVEALDDVVFALAPLAPEEARRMLREVRGAALLQGTRGRPSIDHAAAAALLVRLSALITAEPEIAEIDLNPVFLRPKGLAIANARVVLR